MEWLSSKLAYTPASFNQQKKGFDIDPLTRTFTNEEGTSIYLTAKEFDLLHFLMLHKGQVFTKDQLYENVWGFHIRMDGPGRAGCPAVRGRLARHILPPLPLALVRGNEVGGLDGAL